MQWPAPVTVLSICVLALISVSSIAIGQEQPEKSGLPEAVRFILKPSSAKAAEPESTVAARLITNTNRSLVISPSPAVGLVNAGSQYFHQPPAHPVGLDSELCHFR